MLQQLEPRRYILYKENENRTEETVMWVSSKVLRHVPWGCVRGLYDQGYLYSYDPDGSKDSEKFEGTVQR